MDAFVVRTKKRKNPEETEETTKLKYSPENSAVDADIVQGSSEGNDTVIDRSSSKWMWPTSETVKWRSLTGENLNCTYCILYQKKLADEIFKMCEDQIEYNSGHLTKVQIFGKWHDIPRKQVNIWGVWRQKQVSQASSSILWNTITNWCLTEIPASDPLIFTYGCIFVSTSLLLVLSFRPTVFQF